MMALTRKEQSVEQINIPTSEVTFFRVLFVLELVYICLHDEIYLYK
jgi:hypothetical protein